MRVTSPRVTSPRLASPIVVYTAKNGEYAVPNLPTGTNYTLTVAGNRRFPFYFTPGTRTYNLRGDITGANFNYFGQD